MTASHLPSVSVPPVGLVPPAITMAFSLIYIEGDETV
uniref:Photosystem I reaction center subunit VIII n=3 Tax=Selaginella TaxID=3246 RepID=A0A482CJ58_9TRAC|nr:photosystem I subunit VIII [Selaginella sanguinolenta]QBL76362.1 photosystem I subunit VIII [Selaginella sanguinolenta]QGU93124.1 photosystem I subunit VIII [Selaginella nummulariifolia]QGU93194.1 photosystem I subunit VIII [Selaginella rossii]QGU93263.1 photosystem I subunit VIII [Selaginella sanguinolenta]